MKIESEDIDIESLLSGRYFSIPRFQRPYSWTDENIQDLWDDVMAARGEDYFIGSMVVYREGKQEFGVVDGQQRLTTITVLLCILRDAFAALQEQDLAEGLHQLVERKNRINKNEYVLKTETSFPFFQERILRFGPAEITQFTEMAEEQALRIAYDTLTEKVSSVTKAVDSDSSVPAEDKHSLKVERLTQLRESVLNLKVILVKLENEDDAYLIFETLNTRGKDLAVTDLIKNHFTKHMKAKSSVDAVKLKWGSILKTIHDSSADITSDAFIHHFWLSRYEAVPLKKLYPVMKKKITSKEAPAYLAALEQDAAYYRAIHEPTFMWEKGEVRAARALAAIQLFRLVQPTPAVLSLVRAYKSKKIKLGKLAEALEAIENFHFAFTAVTSSRSSGGISGMYSSFGRKLFECDDPNTAAIEIKLFIEKLRSRRPPLDEFKVGFKQIVYTSANSKQRNLVRYILRKFAEEGTYRFSVDFEDLTIEHLAPQDLIGTAEWNEETIGQLGNLFFLDPKMNGKLSNKPFTDKLELLEANSCSIPEFIRSRFEWDETAIVAHTGAMAELAYSKIWAI